MAQKKMSNRNDKEEEYDVKEIEWEHGVIRLHIPKKEDTQEEIDEMYRTIAKVKLNTYRDKLKARKEHSKEN